MTPRPRHTSPIDPGFVPASLWTRNFLATCARTAGSSALAIGLRRPDGTASVFRTQVLPAGAGDADNFLHVERTVKFLLWARGGDEVLLSGPLAASWPGRFAVSMSPAAFARLTLTLSANFSNVH